MSGHKLFGGKDPFETENDSDDFPDEKKASSEDNEFAQLLQQDGKVSQNFRRIRKGDRIEAKVINVGDSLIYLDIGQRSEGFAEKQFFSAEDLQKMKPGDTLPLYVASTDNGIELVKSLSAQQASLDSLQSAYQSNLPVSGKVVAENKGGFVVELPGTKGFVPFSQMEFGKSKPANEYLGKTFEFSITRFQGREAVLSRSALIREEVEMQRQKVLNTLEEGQQISSKVTKLEEFGAFVDIGSGVTALIPRSEIGWSRSASVSDVLKVGDDVSVKIIRIDRTGPKLKIAASMKQLDGDPWDVSADKLNVGQTVEGTPTKLMPFGAFVEIAPGLEGLVHISEMSAKRRISQPGEVVTVGKKVNVRITSIDRINKRIGLSMKAMDEEVLDSETKAKYLKEQEKHDEHKGVEFIDSKLPAHSIFGDAFARAKKKK